MKKLTVALYFVPALAMAHPGHSETAHVYVHPGILFLTGLAASAWLVFGRRAVPCKAVRTR